MLKPEYSLESPPGSFDMARPLYPVPKLITAYVVVRPVSLRREWTSDSRNPLPEYVATAVESLRDDFVVISVADLDGMQEWALEPLPRPMALHAGAGRDLLGLIRMRVWTRGRSGMDRSGALAYRVPLF
jgi:hypothetical protein